MKDNFSWENFISTDTAKDYFKGIKFKLISDHKEGHKIFPNPKSFFRAFQLCPFQKTKVVILGQDPYHTRDVADGLAFSTESQNPIPPSLKNIFKEMHDDIGIENNSPDLTKWADQGVLLLNTSLSVCEGLPNSHSNIGWEIFTDAALRELNQLNHVVYILWGAHARSKKKLITNSSLILEATHPSPLSAHKGFFGSNHFSKANEYLTRFRDSPINWQLD